MEQANPKISVDYGQDAIMVTLKYEKILEDSDIQSLEESILPIIEENDKIKFVINFCNVKFLSSAMLGLLIRINKLISEKNGQLRLCSINDKIMGVFKITRLDKVFAISDDPIKALSSFE